MKRSFKILVIVLLVPLGLFLLLIVTANVFNYIDAHMEGKTLTDISAYNTMWTDYERYNGEDKSILFPESIDKQDVDNYMFIYNKHIFFPEWQVEVVIKYDEEEFVDEVERIKTVCRCSPIFSKTDYFDNRAYASIWNYEGCFEYAIVDKENMKIAYIYLESTGYDDEKLKIDEKYVPKDFYDRVESEEYTGSFYAYIPA